IEIQGVLASEPEPAHDGIFLRLRTESLRYHGGLLPASGVVRLFVPAGEPASNDDLDALDLHYGTRILVTCDLEREERYLNPGVISRISILDRQGIDAACNVKSPLLIERINSESVLLPFAWVYESRAGLIAAFNELFSVSTAGVLNASLLGDKYFLDRQTADAFRDGGTFHVLVISGLHITFIGGLLVLLLSACTSKRVIQLSIAGGILWCYTLAVGADVPVVRASLMFSILALAQMIDRNAPLLNSFGGCGLILLAWRPSDLLSPSFQLTFICVGAIIVMAVPIISTMRKIGNWTPTADNPFPPRVPEWLKYSCEWLYWRESVWDVEQSRQLWSAGLFKSGGRWWFRSTGVRDVCIYLFEGIVVSMVVQIWLVPLLVLYFHRISLASVFLNLWVGIVIALESFSAVIAVAISKVSYIAAYPFVRLTELLNILLVDVPALLSTANWINIRVGEYSGAAGAIYAVYFVPLAALGLAVYLWEPFTIVAARRLGGALVSRWLVPVSGFLLIVLGSLIVFHPLSEPRVDGRLRIVFLDVGQGDSSLVTFPNGETMLIDGGGRLEFRKDSPETEGLEELFEPDVPRIGEAVVSTSLWELGHRKVDYLVATHDDTDHLQGLIDVAENFAIGNVVVGSAAGRDDYGLGAQFRSIATRYGAPIIVASAGDILSVGGVNIEILNPVKANDSGSDNNDSVTFRITYGRRAILFTGDIEMESEAGMIQRNLRSDVIKVPHHGSRTSSSQPFVDAVHPTIAVISAGRHSIFGHPHPEVVSRWRGVGASVLTTAENGAITVSTDGEDLEVSTTAKY
ncbi:MAG: ComEC/Rec2 family competence protein, partial [Pyrinomonadaceae bacterium]